MRKPALHLVTFTDPEEFLEELRADREKVYSGILRATKVRRAGGPFPQLQTVAVVATARVGHSVVRLTRFVGQVLSTPRGVEPPETNGQVWAAADALLAQLEDAARAMGLTVRAGMVEAPGDSPDRL
jgi:hypothetical protein